MGRNREVIEARTAYWMSIAEQYAKSKFNGDHPLDERKRRLKSWCGLVLRVDRAVCVQLNLELVP